MTPLRALITAATVVASLLVAFDSASARGNYGHGYHHHGPSVNFSFGYWGGPRYWGPGYWGSGYWGGADYWGPGYWSPPFVYASPPVVMVPQEPRVWVENDQGAAAQPPLPTAPVDANAQQWWYWCASARSYYPYVASCAEGWQRVAPQASQGAR